MASLKLFCPADLFPFQVRRFTQGGSEYKTFAKCRLCKVYPDSNHIEADVDEWVRRLTSAVNAVRERYFTTIFLTPPICEWLPDFSWKG